MKASNKPFNLASRSYERRRGFALILALGLMSLVLLLLVSFSAMISVESTASQQNLAQHIARQNALIGAYQGLGALQQYAGTDQRVTARADIDLANSANPYWVGVWSTTASGTTTPMRWLVSSNSTNTDPSAAVSNDAIIICNAIGKRKLLRTPYFSIKAKAFLASKCPL